MDSLDPLVSVVLCFRNEEASLKEAVESVIHQDYRNWELFLVDDGSTDGGTRMGRRFAARYPGRIFYMDHPYHQSKGPGAGINMAIGRCRGTYVAFLNASDIWLPGKLSRQVQLFCLHKVTVVVEASLCQPTSGHGVRRVPVGAPEGSYKPPELMLRLYPLGTGAAPRMSGVMVHRAVLRRCVFEEIFRGIFQDYHDHAFLCKVYLNETVFVSVSCHHKAGARDDGMHASEESHATRRNFLYWLRDYLSAQPVRYRSVEKLLRKAHMRYRKPVRYNLLVAVQRFLARVMAKPRVSISDKT